MPYGIKPSRVARVLRRVPGARALVSLGLLWWRRASFELRWRLLTNPRSRRKFLSHPPRLNAAQQAVFEELARDGVALSRFDAFFPDPARWDELCGIVRAFAGSEPVQKGLEAYRTEFRKAQPKKEILSKYWITLHEEDPTFAADDWWLKIALDPLILDVVNSYFGLWAKLNYLDLWHTVAIDEDRPRVSSQKWHRDPEDRRKLRIYLYFSDVHEGAGPLEYICGSHCGGPYENLWPWGLKSRNAELSPPQEELERRIPRAAWKTCGGPPGTLVFCDTIGFHRGGISRAGSRVLATWGFLTPASLYQRRYSVDWSHPGPQLSEAARFAVT